MWPWQRSRRAKVDLSNLVWDLHSHLVPGVDDGAQTIDDALDMVGAMAQLGYRGMVLTPHVMADLYPNTPATLLPAFEALKEAVAHSEWDMDLRLAAEYHLDQGFMELVDRDELLSFPCGMGTTSAKLVLMEFGFHQAPPEGMVKEACFQLQTLGYTPLLAHCERYPYLHEDESLLELWHERGGWMSVNAASLSGAYGPETQAMAERCMGRGWVSFLCSDAHGMRHIRALDAVRSSEAVARWMRSGDPKHLGLGPH